MPRVYIPQSYSRKFMNYETELPFIDYMRSLVEYSIQIPYDMRSGIGLRSRVNRAMSNAGRQTMQKWHDEMLPKHFEEGAFHEYADPANNIYTPRTGAYYERRLNEKNVPPYKPLFFKGDTFTWTRDKYRVAATAERATVTMSVPFYIMGYRRTDHHNTEGEITKISPREIRELGEFYGRQMRGNFATEAEFSLEDRMSFADGVID